MGCRIPLLIPNARLIKTEWLVANVTSPHLSPDRGERAIQEQEMVLDVSLANSGRFCDRRATL